MKNSNRLHFYQVAILKQNIMELTYSYTQELPLGAIVRVKLQGRLKTGVIVAKTEEPEFKTLNIESVDEVETFSSFQLEMAKFISTYYFSAYGEALSLFMPHPKEPPTLEITKLPEINLPELTKPQQDAYLKLSKMDLGLLFGVTGSGKTELYITQITKKLEEGKSALILMPEIALTPQMELRLKSYFGDLVGVWHSKLSKKEREATLKRIQRGEIRVLAGARSALFLPLQDLGFIVVDEEHDDSYKSNSRPRYNARDLAIYFGKKLNAQVWLGSATPSLTSFVKYPVTRLKEPFIKSQKSFKFIPGSSISSEIIGHIRRNFENEEQSLLFVPTRANFKYLYCSQCGATHKCPFCSVGMSLDSWKRCLKCHYCNYVEKIRDTCVECGYSPLSSSRIGTQEAIEIIKNEIPEIEIEQFDKSVITTPKKLQKALDRVAKNRSNLLVGTQMLSKGHDYPNITLSIITGLDYILGVSDYRAKERAVSLMHQIAGRSGRAKKGLVLIQTAQREFFEPYIDDYEKFLEEEIEFAKDFYPPFMRLARVLIADKNQDQARKKTDKIVKELEQFEDVEIVGFGEAPIKKIANRYRYTVLLRAKKQSQLLNALYGVDRSGVEIDMEPVDFA